MVSIPDQNFLLTKMILRTIEDWSLRQTNRYLQYATKHLCIKKWNYIQKKTFLMMLNKINFRALSPTKPLEKSKLLLKTSDAIILKSNNTSRHFFFFFQDCCSKLLQRALQIVLLSESNPNLNMINKVGSFEKKVDRQSSWAQFSTTVTKDHYRYAFFNVIHEHYN